MKAGIEAISLYSPRYYLDLKTLAAERGIEPDKYYNGLGQERMAVIPPDEDIVTMAANAVKKAIEHIDMRTIDTLILATESGIDQSKSAAIYVHRLVGLPSTCKAYEVKQACCSATAVLFGALAQAQVMPGKRIVIVATDVARYGLGTAGEPTSGAGAVAMVISSTPKLVAFDIAHGSYTADVMDFWRPNYMTEALVDGKYSIRVYLKALAEAWNEYFKVTGLGFTDHYRFCYHLPFTRMAEKGHRHLAKYSAPEGTTLDELIEQVYASQRYNRQTGNLYTGSLFAALTSLLESHEKLDEKRVGMFSYGSGCMGIFFGGTVLAGYSQHVLGEYHREMLDERINLSYRDYEIMYNFRMPQDGSAFETPKYKTGLYRLAGVNKHKRLYEERASLSGTQEVQVEKNAEQPSARQHSALSPAAGKKQ